MHCEWPGEKEVEESMSLEAIILEQMTILTAHRPQNVSISLLDVPWLPAFEVRVFMITFYGQGKIRTI